MKTFFAASHLILKTYNLRPNTNLLLHGKWAEISRLLLEPWLLLEPEPFLQKKWSQSFIKIKNKFRQWFKRSWLYYRHTKLALGFLKNMKKIERCWVDVCFYSQISSSNKFFPLKFVLTNAIKTFSTLNIRISFIYFPWSCNLSWEVLLG